MGSAKHESSLFFQGKQLFSLRNFDLRSFTASKQPRKLQASFWPNSFGKFGPTHLSSTQTRVLDESKPSSCMGSLAASYIHEG
jgi:hypothetical protein